MFRRSLTPDDLHPAIWNRRQILHDLDGRRPAEAIRQYFGEFLDNEVMERGGAESNQQMDWGLFIWRLSVTDPAERDARIDEAAERLPDDEAMHAKFQVDVRALIALHEGLFPTLHATLARLRAANNTAETNGAASHTFEFECQSPDSAPATPSTPTRDPMVEFAQPLLEAAGSDPAVIARALVTAGDLWSAAQAPVDRRVQILRSLRARLPAEEHADFDEISRMMLRRYREMFAPGAATDARPTTDDRRPRTDEHATAPEDEGQEMDEPAAKDDTETPQGSLLGRWLRRRR
jgi:hypothetical protein